MINAINDYMLPCWCVSCSWCLLLVAPLALYESYKFHSYSHELQETRQRET